MTHHTVMSPSLAAKASKGSLTSVQSSDSFGVGATWDAYGCLLLADVTANDIRHAQCFAGLVVVVDANTKHPILQASRAESKPDRFADWPGEFSQR